MGNNFLYAQKQIDAENIRTVLSELMHPESGDSHACHFHHYGNEELLNVNLSGETLEVFIDFDETPDRDQYDGLLEMLLPAIEEMGFKSLKIFQALPNNKKIDLELLFEKEGFIPFEKSINEDPAEDISGEKSGTNQRGANPQFGQGLPTGSLSGKTVWLSPGHGWLWNTNTNSFLTQRGNTNDMVEDFGSIDNVNQQFIQYLRNAGANVWSVREKDSNPNEVIVDNDDGAPGYTTTGAWSTSSSTGYNGGTYEFVFSAPTTTATAIYTPSIPKEGWYWISVFYREGGNRSVDTQYEVNHAGGSTIVSINQEVHGLTWVHLGQFYFDQGTAGNVSLLNQSSDPAGSQAIIADAVRFGGGTGQLNDCAYPSSPPSNHDRADESARQYARFQGYPTCESDVVTRPHYAEWELAKGTTTEQNNAVYVSLHSNAFNGSARGTVTYMYNGTSTPNSSLLRNLLQQELIDAIHSCWDAGWQDRGVNSANFGEVRELTTMPGALVELAFHDNIDDAAALTNPYFRDLAARAMYKAILKFFNQRDGSPVTMTPDSPTHTMAFNSGNGSITLEWDAPIVDCFSGDAATGYQVYMGTHGYGFEDGIAVSGTSYTFTGLNPNTTYYFQVSSTNAGGESFPTATVAARTPNACFEVPLLIVDGFDRLDRSANVNRYESAALGTVKRMFLEQMNAYDYMVPHARSIGNCGVPFDGASNEAIIAGYLNLTDYEALDWITGEESTADRTFDATEQSLISSFMNGGGKWIVSGAEIGWDIGRSSSPNAAVSFYNNYLKAVYSGDDGGTYDFSGTGIMAGVNGSFDDNANCDYNAEYPDRLGSTGGSSVVMNYAGGTSDGAGVAYNGADYGVVYFGFPLETVTNSNTRDLIFCNALNYLGIEDPNIGGCTDPLACNFNALANCDDASCLLPDGCTNIVACNYNPAALCDNGTCLLPDGCTDPAACNYLASASCDNGSCILPDGCTNANACNYDPTALCDDNSCVLPDGCTAVIACNYNPAALCDNGTCIFPDGCTNAAACNYDPAAICDDNSCVLPDGCTDPVACNYNPAAVCDDGSCLSAGCNIAAACNYDPNASCNDGSCILPDGCTNPAACNYNASALCDNNTCVFPDGCTNVSACNYDSNALCDDGSCLLPDGCTDPSACNYSASALCDDNSCELPDGCTNQTACNYNPSALCDDGSCILPDDCADPTACNYNPNAMCDDGSCVFAPNPSFTGLNASYCTSDGPVTLIPAVSGGTFSGPGIVGNVFTPASVGTFGVTINITYTIGSAGCMDVSVLSTVVDPCTNPGLSLDLKAMLEGPFDPSINLMRTGLRNFDLIPLSQPYGVAPWNYSGLESVGSTASLPANMVDWVLVEMRTGTPQTTGSKGTTLVESVAGFILDNGDIVATDGISPLTFNQLSLGVNYHILLRHRNHLDVISNVPVTGANSMSFDFSNSNTAFGPSQLKSEGNKFVLYGGDYAIDGIIQNTDRSVWYANPAAVQVYMYQDGNLDGYNQATDYDLWYINRSKNGIEEVRLP